MRPLIPGLKLLAQQPVRSFDLLRREHGVVRARIDEQRRFRDLGIFLVMQAGEVELR